MYLNLFTNNLQIEFNSAIDHDQLVSPVLKRVFLFPEQWRSPVEKMAATWG